MGTRRGVVSSVPFLRGVCRFAGDSVGDSDAGELPLLTGMLMFDNMLSSPSAHCPLPIVLGEGVPWMDVDAMDMSATKSSEDFFVWEKEGSMMELAIPRPSIFPAVIVCLLSSLSGSVMIDEGMLKSSSDSIDSPPSSAPLTAEVAVFDATSGLFHCGCGSRLTIPNVPVPTFAHRQMPREEVCSSDSPEA